jgi:uncharacterized membrane protein YkvA (DUF1232 family)
MPLVDKLRDGARRIKRDSVTLWFAGKHADTPLLPKAICLLVVLYALSPIDLIPDFIPVLGYVDDVLLLPALIWLAVRLLPPAVLADCRESAAQWMEREGRKPRNAWGIVFVLGVWALAAWLMWKYLPSFNWWPA